MAAELSSSQDSPFVTSVIHFGPEEEVRQDNSCAVLRIPWASTLFPWKGTAATVSPRLLAHIPPRDAGPESRRHRGKNPRKPEKGENPSLTLQVFQDYQDVLLQNSGAADHVRFPRQVMASGIPGRWLYPGRHTYSTLLPTGKTVWLLYGSFSSANTRLVGASQPATKKDKPAQVLKESRKSRFGRAGGRVTFRALFEHLPCSQTGTGGSQVLFSWHSTTLWPRRT